MKVAKEEEKKKMEERMYLELFFRNAGFLDNIDELLVYIHNYETPDFIISLPEGEIGVDVTRLYYEPRQRPKRDWPAPKYSRQKRITKLAQKIYESGDGPPVGVMINFNRSSKLSDKHIRGVAEAISDFVREHIPDEGKDYEECSPWLSHNGFPEHVQRIHILRPEGVSISSFMTFSTDIRPVLTREDIERVLKNKEKKLQGYRARCSKCREMWLVIVCNHEMATEFAVDRKLFEETFTSGFDRAFVFLGMDKAAHELKIRKPAEGNSS